MRNKYEIMLDNLANRIAAVAEKRIKELRERG